MYGEKFIEKKIEGNKVIRTYEFKQFEFDFGKVEDYIVNYWNDDGLFLHEVGIYYSADDSLNFLDVDSVLEAVCLEIQERIDDEGEDADIKDLKSFIKPLKEAKGFTIYFDRDEDFYKEEKKNE